MSPEASTEAKKPKSPPQPQRVDLIVLANERGIPNSVMAARLGLSLMKALDVRTWDEVPGHPKLANIYVPEEQERLLQENAWVLPLLRWRSTQTIYVCDTCGMYGLLSEGASDSSDEDASVTKPPTKCNLNLGCEGKVFHARISVPKLKGWQKARNAKRESAEEDADE